MKILLVEDTRILQGLMLAVLGNLIHKVDVANNGEVALKQLKSGDFDLVVMDGLEATKIIRSWSCNKSTIPIIVRF
ncbi:response regulator [Colwellia psychrerythraea]|uniref:Response regulator receiver protein n=1 Tax=Colwellia psychrerythraea TaxID=28229 RepID=A0A099KGC9_COLPS|nr:response regulator [Colwellia psychrerythraea]KGJ89052.1 response regulator receiver protein [Colwellia psychrerythraea]